jgi:hypothetical protein
MFCKVEKNPRQRAEKESVLFGKVETISTFLGRSEKSCGTSLIGTVETSALLHRGGKRCGTVHTHGEKQCGTVHKYGEIRCGTVLF